MVVASALWCECATVAWSGMQISSIPLMIDDTWKSYYFSFCFHAHSVLKYPSFVFPVTIVDCCGLLFGGNTKSWWATHWDCIGAIVILYSILSILFTACHGWYILCSTVFSAVAVQKSNCLASMINQTVEKIISFASERSKLMSWRFHTFVSTLALSI